MKVFNVLFSYYFVIFLLAVLGIGAGVATFLESIYDIQTARVVVYDSTWYEVVMALIAISLLGIIYKRKMYKKIGIFLFHMAFIIILLGAGLTRYLGEEGVIHIREGMSDNQMITTKSYLQIQIKDNILDRELELSQVGNNYFKFKFNIDKISLHVEFLEYLPKHKSGLDRLKIKVILNDKEEKIVEIDGGRGWVQTPVEVTFENTSLLVAWGSKLKDLPFKIELKDFKLQRYAGSKSPSSYESDIVLVDKKEKLYYTIFMNHPLTYKGYKFFQSSYDKDELGTILEVNKDPGKWPTYFGYFLLTLGLILNFFDKKSRFKKLRKFLKNANISLLLVLFATFSTPMFASNVDFLENFGRNSLMHSKEFSKLLIQDLGGRVKPLNSEALDLVNKITGKSSLYGLNSEQIVLGMLIEPKRWQKIEMIKIKNIDIKKHLKLPLDRKYVSFSQMFDEAGYYKLAKLVDNANRKAESKRGTLEKDLIKLDERLNVAYLTYKGLFFRFIPLLSSENNQWLDLNDAMKNPNISDSTKDIIYNYLDEVEQAFSTNDWKKANSLLDWIKQNQIKNSADILPSDTQIGIEIFYNKIFIFKKLFIYYFILGFVALGVSLISIFLDKKSKKIETSILYLFALGLVAHTIGLAIRWYISGHAPWSDSYESLVYIAWSSIFAGIVVFRKSTLALATSSLLAGVIMLVAHLSFINPQVTNLVPVLKSYWLSIHVSVITASYGFLGLSFMLGFMSLALMVFKSKTNETKINNQIRYLSAINEISLIIGLSMLAVGNFFGGIWANESWGRYWGWDPKETWAFVSIVVYTIVLHLRFIPRLNSIYTLCVASVFAFASIIMTYFGVNFYLTGMHSYASSEGSPSVPVFVYYVLVVIVGVTVLAYRKKDVKNI